MKIKTKKKEKKTSQHYLAHQKGSESKTNTYKNQDKKRSEKKKTNTGTEGDQDSCLQMRERKTA